MGGGGGMGGAPGGGAAPQPQARTPDVAPPALPGAGMAAPLPAGPVLSKPGTGDPNAELFTAIDKGDDTGAQDALSRGADLNAQNQFGETPLDLSIALNRTSITFLLLQTRNELNEQGGPAQPLGQPWLLHNATSSASKPVKPKNKHVTYPAPEQVRAQPRVSLPTNGGTADPQAGFLGFGPKN